MAAIRQQVPMSGTGRHETTTLKMVHLASGHWRNDAAEEWMSAIGHQFGRPL